MKKIIAVLALAVTAVTGLAVADTDPPEAEAVVGCFVAPYIYGYNPNYYFSVCTGGNMMMGEQYRSVARCTWPKQVRYTYGSWEPAKRNDGWAPVNDTSKAYCPVWWRLDPAGSSVQFRYNIYI